MGSDWFATRQLDDDVFLIGEPPHVNSFLVVGDERAALIDSGLGVDRIRPVAESLTDRPIEVVNTHYHWDHSGGNEEFERTRDPRAGRRGSWRRACPPRTSPSTCRCSTW